MACDSRPLWLKTYQRTGKTPYPQYQQHFLQQVLQQAHPHQKSGIQQPAHRMLNDAEFKVLWLTSTECVVGCCIKNLNI